MFSLLVLLASLSLVACGNQASSGQTGKGMKIVTSFYPVYALTKEVSGDLNDIRMIQSGQGIHGFEPSVADIQAIYDADVFFYHSHILESWGGAIDPNEAKSDVILIETAKDLDLQRVEGLEDVEVGPGVDPATLYDPHSWLDPVLVADQAETIARELGQLDPDNKDYYQKNADALKKEFLELNDKYQKIFKQTSQKTFVTQHTAFAYTAKRFGLQQLGVLGVAEEEPSPRQLAEIEEFIKDYKVKTIFVEKGVSDKMAQTLKQATGVKLTLLDPLEGDPKSQKSYIQLLEENLAILANELK
ncbi:metal ABC transporter solute-binding protein, Zn/Mn family [Streptococcus varani]|nr:zinc ABC transporter substrate-binding protein [Streptococcus varani]